MNSLSFTTSTGISSYPFPEPNSVLAVLIKHLEKPEVQEDLPIKIELKGGWEAWLQVELATQLKKLEKASAPTGGLREEAVYETGATAKGDKKWVPRADIVYLGGVQGDIVELKCQRGYKEAGATKFANEFDEDFRKIQYLRLKGNSAPATLTVVGVSPLNDFSMEYMSELVKKNNYAVGYVVVGKVIVWNIGRREWKDNTDAWVLGDWAVYGTLMDGANQ